jgi:Ser/Thr protein kinase RdoA (MazF antagonist)
MAQPDASRAYLELTPDDVLDAVDNLGHETNGRLLALASYENRVYQVGREDKAPLVAKFYRPARWSDAAILEEHALALDLAAAEIPVVPPELHDGTTLHHQGNFRLALYPCYGGRPPELDNLSLLTQLGRFVARIHLIGEQQIFQHRPTLDMESFGITSCRFLLDEGFIPGDLEDAYVSTCEHLFAAIEDCYERAGNVRMLRLHGDFHPGNVLVRESEMHIVDLDDARMGPAVQDLWMLMSGDRNEQTPQLEKLLEGYQEFRDFDRRELHLIEALRTLRIMHYAAWLAQRWQDPAFQIAFPWFNSRRYWDEHVLALREQAALLAEPPLNPD